MSCLASKADHAMPLEFFRDMLRRAFLRSTRWQRQIETALNWGRYSGIFTYDRRSRPAASAPAAAPQDEAAAVHQA